MSRKIPWAWPSGRLASAAVLLSMVRYVASFLLLLNIGSTLATHERVAVGVISAVVVPTSLLLQLYGARRSDIRVVALGAITAVAGAVALFGSQLSR